MEEEGFDKNISKVFGPYEVMDLCDFKDKYGHKMYHVRCTKCGWEHDLRLFDITHATRCSHLGSDGRYADRETQWHNKCLKGIFSRMKSRCYNENDKDYRWYGAKGIKICEEWLDDKLSFERWAISNGYEYGLTIDRIDSNKDYSPSNCRWITNEENARYKSSTRIIEVDGISKTGRMWGDSLNVGTNTINMMIREYGENMTKQFIRLRLSSLDRKRDGKKTWMKTYGLIE